MNIDMMAGHASEKTNNILDGSDVYSGMFECETATEPETSADFPGLYKDSLTKTLNEMRKEEFLCDVTLLIGPDKVPMKAHRIVLTGFSEYFKTMFTDGKKEAKQDEVVLPAFDPECMKVILGHAYSGTPAITKENVHQIIIYANFFRSENLIDQCLLFISNLTNVQNCVQLFQFADQYDIVKLRDQAMSYIGENIETIYKENLNFAQLPNSLLLKVIEHPSTVISSSNPAENERQLFMILWSRVGSVSEAEKKEFTLKVLKAIHLPQLNGEFLTSIEREVEHIEMAKELIEEARKEISPAERRYWYLARFKSTGTVNFTENKKPILINGSEVLLYSRCALIRGFPWFVHGSKLVNNRYYDNYRVHLESPVAIEDLGLVHKVVVKTRSTAQNTYFMGKAEKKHVDGSFSVGERFNIEVQF